MSENNMERRDFIKKTAVLTVGGLVLASLPGSLVDAATPPPAETDAFTLPPLPYAYDALEPFIDKQTMEIHHSKHHQAYVTNLNKALAGDKTSYKDIAELCRTIHDGNYALRNNGGGHFNHSFFWKLMKPKKEGAPAPSGHLVDAINASFGSMDAFKTKFNDKAKTVFGSGWCWLVVSDVYKLEIGTTSNQDNPLMQFSTCKGVPVLALDVWEHAYYLKHQNMRAEYANDWWNVINWEEAERLFLSAQK
jgi:Fe-Mn family superoxide dismutase